MNFKKVRSDPRVTETTSDYQKFAAYDINFLVHLAEGHVSYCHHFASVVVVVLDQLEQNLV